MILLRFIFSLLFTLLATSTVLALNLSSLHEIQLPIPTTLADRTLGTAIATAEMTVAVAAHSSDNDIAGSAYLYDVRENWRLTAELTSQHTADYFAKAIVLKDKRLIISADHDDSLGKNSGAVYIFERNTEDNLHRWQQTAKLTASDGLAGDQFGSAIALVNDVLYIGASMRGQGKVYIFTRDSESGAWQETNSIEPIDSQALRFGASIAQDGQNLIIGAPYTDADNSPVAAAKTRQPRFAISKGDTDDPGIESGAIFVYQKIAGEWLPTARIGATNRETADHLGENIAIQGDIIAASIKQKDVFDDLRAGAVYVYKQLANEWQEDVALVASNPNVGANFGISFTLKDKQILVGANKIHANGFNSGQAYLFAQNASRDWELIHQQENAALKAHDQFGLSVSLGSEFILSASNHAVYAFQDAPIQYHSAVFYLQSNTLQLNEVDVAGLGVFQATLNFSLAADIMILTLTDYQIRTDLKASDINYSLSTGRLTIPQLALQTSSGELAYYAVELQQMENSASIQFQVLSFNPIDP